MAQGWDSSFLHPNEAAHAPERQPWPLPRHGAMEKLARMAQLALALGLTSLLVGALAFSWADTSLPRNYDTLHELSGLAIACELNRTSDKSGLHKQFLDISKILHPDKRYLHADVTVSSECTIEKITKALMKLHTMHPDAGSDIHTAWLLKPVIAALPLSCDGEKLAPRQCATYINAFLTWFAVITTLCVIVLGAVVLHRRAPPTDEPQTDGPTMNEPQTGAPPAMSTRTDAPPTGMFPIHFKKGANKTEMEKVEALVDKIDGLELMSAPEHETPAPTSTSMEVGLRGPKVVQLQVLCGDGSKPSLASALEKLFVSEASDVPATGASAGASGSGVQASNGPSKRRSNSAPRVARFALAMMLGGALGQADVRVGKNLMVPFHIKYTRKVESLLADENATFPPCAPKCNVTHVRGELDANIKRCVDEGWLTHTVYNYRCTCDKGSNALPVCLPLSSVSWSPESRAADDPISKACNYYATDIPTPFTRAWSYGLHLTFLLLFVVFFGLGLAGGGAPCLVLAGVFLMLGMYLANWYYNFSEETLPEERRVTYHLVGPVADGFHTDWSEYGGRKSVMDDDHEEL